MAALGADLRSTEPFRWWLVYYFSPQAHRYREKNVMNKAMQSAPFRFQPEDYWIFFAGIGWAPELVRYLAEVAELLGRPARFPWPARLQTALGGLLSSEEQRNQVKRYTGLVRFVPQD